MFKELMKEIESINRYKWYGYFYALIGIIAFFKDKEHFWTLMIGAEILGGISVIINNQNNNKTNK